MPPDSQSRFRAGWKQLSEIFVFGAGGRGREVSDLILDSGGSTVGFLDDFSSGNDFIDGVPILRPEEIAHVDHWVIAVGEPFWRKSFRERLINFSENNVSIISKSAFISKSAHIGDGSVISAYCSVQAGAIIANNVDLNTSSIIGHDVMVGENSVISSQVNLGGGVIIGSECYVGMGVLIKEGVTIGSGSIIGMGSICYQDIPEGVIALGNPCRVAKRNETKLVFKR